jgi:hypothetical protein
MTDYIVLKRREHYTGGGNSGTAAAPWDIIGHREASNPHAARKGVDPSDGEYLVVPVRNASFISGTTVTPEPKAMSVDVSADTYLGVQQELPTEQEGEATDEPREGIEVPADGTEHVLDAA